MASKGDIPAMLVLNIKEEQDDVRSFTIRSSPIRDKRDDPVTLVEHCTGYIVKHNHLTADGRLRGGFRPDTFGLLGGDLILEDVGKPGLEKLHAEHSEVLHATKEEFYGRICMENIMEYKDGFQLIEYIHINPDTKSMMARVSKMI